MFDNNSITHSRDILVTDTHTKTHTHTDAGENIKAPHYQADDKN